MEIGDHSFNVRKKYTLQEWHLNNELRYRCSKAQQELADRLLAESQRICELSSDAVKLNKEETDYQIKKTHDEVEYYKKELILVRKELLLEIDALGIYKVRINDTLASMKKNALKTVIECISLREKRVGIDLVVDNAERELLKEREVIEGSEKLLSKCLEEIQEQIRRAKSIMYNVDRNLEGKEAYSMITNRNLQLKETNTSLCTYHGKESINPSNASKSDWEEEASDIIVRATKEINSARPLRNYMDSIMRQVVDDLNSQKNATESALHARIEETREAKTKLELQHSEVMRQANEMTCEVMSIEKSIAEKENYMGLAHSRLGNRCNLPGPELCRTNDQIQLTKEVDDLHKTVAKLQQALCEVQASLRYLLKTQIQLEEEINIKTNTLEIDEVHCLTIHQTIDFHAY